jgi:hypothetical protein
VRITGSNTARQIVVDKVSPEKQERKVVEADLKICPEIALLTVE